MPDGGTNTTHPKRKWYRKFSFPHLKWCFFSQRLIQRSTPSFDDAFKDSTESYAEFFDNEKSSFEICFPIERLVSFEFSCRNSSQTKIRPMEQSQTGLSTSGKSSKTMAKSRTSTCRTTRLRSQSKIQRIDSILSDWLFCLDQICDWREFRSYWNRSVKRINFTANIWRTKKQENEFDFSIFFCFSLVKIVETELENVRDYENFNDCLDTFPL